MKKKTLVTAGIVFLVLLIGFFNSSDNNCLDEDNDSICDKDDLCLDSLPGEPVDENGCDAFQFCEKFYCSMNCFSADFIPIGESPEFVNPRDCTVVLIYNEGQIEPRCVPLECGCKKELLIPDVTIKGQVFLAINSYWVVDLLNVPDGFAQINNSRYEGWCVDEFNPLSSKGIYNFKMYSSLDPDLEEKCSYCFDEDWDKVNYIINHKKGNMTDIQEAIWYFVNGGIYPSNPYSIEMVEEANEFGEGYKPGCGEFFAIILDSGEKNQLIIIEVDP